MENISYNELRAYYMDAVMNGKDTIYIKGVGTFAKQFILLIMAKKLEEECDVQIKEHLL